MARHRPTPRTYSAVAMGAMAALAAGSLRVEPGGQASVEIRVTNTGSIVDQYTLEFLGDAAGWATIDPPTLSLLPGTAGTALIVFRPPREPSLRAGAMPFGVLVRPSEDPSGAVSEEGTIEIGEFREPSAELIPRTSRGSRGASHELALDNRGNVPLNAKAEGVDPDRLVELRIDPPVVAVGPGEASFAKVRVRPARTFWRGAPKTRNFQLAVQPDDGQPLVLTGTYLQEALLPSWLGRAVAAAIAVVAMAVVLWAVVLQPQIKSNAEEALREFGYTPRPTAAAPTPRTSSGSGSLPPATLRPSPPPPTVVSPPAGATGPSPVAGRLVGAMGVKLSGGTLMITDLVFSNPDGAAGKLVLRRGTEALLVLKLDNFRDLDFHFVTPIVISDGQTLELAPTCATCQPAVLYSGSIQP
jgi:hypothetical protein